MLHFGLDNPEVQSRRNWLLFAAFGVIAAALAFGAWAGFPVYADACIPLLVRELPPGGLAADNPDRPLYGWLLAGTVRLFGFGPGLAAVLVLVFWSVLAAQTAVLWKRLFPGRADLRWLPALAVLSPAVVRTHFEAVVTLYPANAPVILVLAGLLTGLRPDPTARRWRWAGVFALSGLAASLSEYGVATAIASIAAALVLSRVRLAAFLAAGAAAGALVHGGMTDRAARPNVLASTQLPELLADPARPLLRWISGLWHAVVGAWGEAASRVDLDSLSRSSVAAVVLGALTAVLALAAWRRGGAEEVASRSPRVSWALLAAVASGILPIVLANRPASMANVELVGFASRYLLPVLPFASCFLVDALVRLTRPRLLPVPVALLAFLCGEEAWRSAFAARREQANARALGTTLRPLVRSATGFTLAVVADGPESAIPPIFNGKVTLGWTAEDARRVWILPLHLAVPLVGTRRDCRVPDEIRMPRLYHSVERSGAPLRVVWISAARGIFGEPEPYCTGPPE